MSEKHGSKEAANVDLPEAFLDKKWRVIVNDTTFGETVFIRLLEGEPGEPKYGLFAGEGAPEPEQKLVYVEATKTLDDDPEGPGPDRCISYWNFRARGQDVDRIFAMRTSRSGGLAANSGYLPWEIKDGVPLDNGDGSWGAEEEGGGLGVKRKGN